MSACFRWGRRGLALLLVALISAEATARLDDWIHLDVPILACPDRERDLMQAEPWGLRGRTNGHFRKWKLNAFGFRSPEMAEAPSPGTVRIVVLGASETLGLYESPDQEYPAQLARKLRNAGRSEVVNGALAGMTLKSMVPFWDNWGSRFGANVVLIYPSPLFYLDEAPPRLTGYEPSKFDPSGPCFRPRLVQRIEDVYRSLPIWMRNWREEQLIAKQSAGKPANWRFSSPPADRRALFVDDLEILVKHIRQAGSEPVLLTHAMSAAVPIREEDRSRLLAFRRFYPRASDEVLLRFTDQSNQAIRDLARREKLRLVDLDAAMSGHVAWFADLVHFNDDGAARAADLIAHNLGPWLAKK